MSMFSSSHVHKLNADKLPTSSYALNFNYAYDSSDHPISFRSSASDGNKLLDALNSGVNNSRFAKFEKSNLRDVENMVQRDLSSSTRDIHFTPSPAKEPVKGESKPVVETFAVNFDNAFDNKQPAAQSAAQPAAQPVAQPVAQPAAQPVAQASSAKPSFVVSPPTLSSSSLDDWATVEKPVVLPAAAAPREEIKDGKIRLDLVCNLVESLLVTEKSQVVDKFELLGTASGTITSSTSLLDEPDLVGHLGVDYSIADSRSVVKNVVSGSKAVSASTSDSGDTKHVSASIDCRDISAFIAKAKASPRTGAPFAIPPIPIFKYSLADSFRPVVVKTKQIMTETEGKVHVTVHVLFNAKVVTGPTLREVSVQVSCSPLGSIEGVDCSKGAGQGKFQSSNKIITWNFGELRLREQPSISMEATVSLATPVDTAALPGIYLPMIVKGTNDSLVSQLEVEAHLPKEGTSVHDIAWGASTAAAKAGNAVLREIVEFRKSTKLECRFL